MALHTQVKEVIFRKNKPKIHQLDQINLIHATKMITNLYKFNTSYPNYKLNLSLNPNKSSYKIKKRKHHLSHKTRKEHRALEEKDLEQITGF